MMLDQPLEVIFEILYFVFDVHDVFSLIRTSKELRSIVLDFLQLCRNETSLLVLFFRHYKTTVFDLRKPSSPVIDFVNSTKHTQPFQIIVSKTTKYPYFVQNCEPVDNFLKTLTERSSTICIWYSNFNPSQKN